MPDKKQSMFMPDHELRRLARGRTIKPKGANSDHAAYLFGDMMTTKVPVWAALSAVAIGMFGGSVVSRPFTVTNSAHNHEVHEVESTGRDASYLERRLRFSHIVGATGGKDTTDGRARIILAINPDARPDVIDRCSAEFTATTTTDRAGLRHVTGLQYAPLDLPRHESRSTILIHSAGKPEIAALTQVLGGAPAVRKLHCS